jgi:DNA-binding NarL/FixJ family response regulator
MQVLIADDHPLYREALRAQVERLLPSAQIIEVSSLDAAIQAAKGGGEAFRLFLLDYHMPGMSHDALKQFASTFPGVPIAVVSGTANSADIRAVIQAGAHGFIPKTASGPHLQHALQLLLAGGTSVPADILLPANEPVAPAAAPAAPWLPTLTSRELEVLRGVARGLSNKQIGRELDLAEVTIKLHLRAIFRKIGARSRAEAAVMATKANIGP